MIIEILIIAGVEVVLFLIFLVIGMYKGHTIRDNFKSLLKGWIERSFICFGLFHDLMIIIVFFGALKLGTRLQDDKTDKISNDQFLMGNIFSITAAMVYYLLLSGRW